MDGREERTGRDPRSAIENGQSLVYLSSLYIVASAEIFGRSGREKGGRSCENMAIVARGLAFSNHDSNISASRP